MLTTLFSEQNQEKMAWAQIVMSIVALAVFMFLGTKAQIVEIGVITMITWTGTALAHLSAAQGNKKLVEDKDQDGQ
jgi:hypothetical protein